MRHPWGSNAIQGYEWIAQYFNLHTMEVPASNRTDSCRLLVHKDVRKLRAISQIIKKAYNAADENAIAAAELKLKSISGMHSFSHNLEYWAPNDDKKTLKALGWKRRIVTFFDHQRRQVYNVVIRTKASTLIFRSPGPNPNKKRKRSVE